MTKATPSRHIVLYADDDHDDILLIKEAFAKYAHSVEVITFPDGVEALHYLENLHPLSAAPCLIILDINMPKMSGKEALVNIRQLSRFEEIPIVIFSTSSLPSDKEFATRYKAGFVSKPLYSKQIEMIADQFVEHCTDEIKRTIKGKLT